MDVDCARDYGRFSSCIHAVGPAWGTSGHGALWREACFVTGVCFRLLGCCSRAALTIVEGHSSCTSAVLPSAAGSGSRPERRDVEGAAPTCLRALVAWRASLPPHVPRPVRVLLFLLISTWCASRVPRDAHARNDGRYLKVYEQALRLSSYEMYTSSMVGRNLMMSSSACC